MKTETKPSHKLDRLTGAVVPDPESPLYDPNYPDRMVSPETDADKAKRKASK